MALGDNAISALFEPADNLSFAVDAAISAGRFIKPATGFQGGPLLDVSTPTAPLTKGNLPQCTICGAAAKAVGVTKWDTAAADDVVGVFTGNQVVPMIAGANITAGVEVESDAAGKPITLAAGRSNGIALNTATTGNTVYVKLFL